MRYIAWIMILALMLTSFTGCKKANSQLSIGVSIAVLNAERWKKDIAYMTKYAEELGVKIETQLSDQDPEHQLEICRDMIDRGIDVLILTPANATQAADIVKLAHQNKVKVISYDRVVLNEAVDLVITFDGIKVGELQGKFLAETADSGNYIVFSGDKDDFNASIYLQGAMEYLQPMADSGAINIVAQSDLPKWSPDEAKRIVQETLAAYDNDIQAILAPNDTTARGCIEALTEVGLEGKVAVTGMDANIAAVQRVIDGTQGMTVFKDIRQLAKTAVEQAVKLGKGEKTNENAVLDTNSKSPVLSLYVEPQLVINANLERVLIESGFYTRDEVYN